MPDEVQFISNVSMVPALPSNYFNFEYSRGSRALIGQWRAKLQMLVDKYDRSIPPKAEDYIDGVKKDNEFELGGKWSIPGFMRKGVLTEITEVGIVIPKDTSPESIKVEDLPEGMELEDLPDEIKYRVYDIAGYDAGFRLMKSPPMVHQISSSDLGGVIKEIADLSGLESDITLESFNELDFKNCVQGQTAANSILDLAMLGGSIAYITPEGILRIAPPNITKVIPTIDWKIGDNKSSSLDLEGYASAVMVVLHRRGEAVEDDTPPGMGRKPWTGTTPPGNLTTISRSGTTALPGGTLSWSYTMLEPIGALTDYSATLFLPGVGITKAYVAHYEYEIKTSVVRIRQQESRVWKWGLVKMASVEDSSTQVTFYSAQLGSTAYETIRQQTATEVHRQYDMNLKRIQSEWSEIKSYDSGAAILPFKKPYDSRTEKAWDWGGLWGDYRGLLTTEYTYEEMDVGVADTVKNEDGSPLKHEQFGQEWFIRIPGTQITMPVRREKVIQVDEVLDRKSGKVVSRVQRSTDDQGRRDMLARGLYSDIYNSDMERTLAMAWLRSLPQRADIQVTQMPGNSSISEEVSVLSQPGRRFRVLTALEKDLKRYVEGVEGEGRCPFLLSDGSCGVFNGLETPSIASQASINKENWIGGGVETTSGSAPDWDITPNPDTFDMPSIPCDYYNEVTEEMNPDYISCSKYQALRHLIGFSGGNTAPAPVVGLAGDGKIYYEKEVYFDEFLSEDKARQAAQKMAGNILKAKRASRGIVETVELPLNVNITPDGSILSVRHDFESLRTQVTFLPSDKEPPEYLMLLSAGGVALNLYERESIGKARTGIGKVVDVRPDRALVVLGGRPVSCTYNMMIKSGNTVLVFLPPGTTTSGVIQAVMGA